MLEILWIKEISQELVYYEDAKKMSLKTKTNQTEERSKERKKERKKQQ